MKVLLGGLVVLASIGAVAAPAPAARVLGCCVTDHPCLPVADEQVSCLLSGGDFISAASGAQCVEVLDLQHDDVTVTTRCTCAGLSGLAGRELVNVLSRLGQCRQLPKGRVCDCPAPVLPNTPTPIPTPTPPPLPTFTVATPSTPEPVGCCQFAGSPGTCRQTTVTDCKRPGRPAVFVQNANCTTEGVCLIIPDPNETPTPRVSHRRLRPFHAGRMRRP